MVKDIFSSMIAPSVYGEQLKKNSKREPVSRSQKNEVLALQKNKCAICKKLLDMRATHFDHIKEVYRGGKSRVENLQALCANCHNIKTHKEKLKKVETRRKTGTSSSKGLWINPLTGKKEKSPKNKGIWGI